jgi:hypothetical protein
MQSISANRYGRSRAEGREDTRVGEYEYKYEYECEYECEYTRRVNSEAEFKAASEVA